MAGDKDLLGRPLTDMEREVVRIHEALRALVAREDLAPCVAGNAAHALAAVAQITNDLGLDVARP